MDSTMKHSKDPFEASIEEEEGSHPESPVGLDENETEDQAALSGSAHGGDDANINPGPENCLTSRAVPISVGTAGSSNKIKEEDEEEEEENMDVQFGKFPSSSDPDKVVKMQYHISGKVVRFAWAGVCKRGENWEGATIVACIQGRIVMAAPTNSKRTILSQFTEEQMNRYESYRRSGFQKSNMKKLLTSITGSSKISLPMTIVVSGIAKLFVGELVETARLVMDERKDTGPIRPCHMRESYRRLKLEGKIPKASVPRLFR